MLDISKIKIEGTQSRTAINEQTITDYCEAISNGAQFPPVVVFFDGNDYWLADGFHRLLAHTRAGKKSIYEDVKTGSKRDAILYSVGANHSHGLRRTNADKRNAVSLLLADSEWAGWSDNAIAKQCHVSSPLVSEVRASLTTTNGVDTQLQRTAQRNGKTYQVNTTNIGPKDTGRTAGDVMRDLDRADTANPTPTPQAPTLDDGESLEPEIAPLYATREEELEQLNAELADLLQDAHKALKDLQNDGAEGYLSEITKLRRELEAVTISRDGLMMENAALKQDIKRLLKKTK